MIRLAKLSLAVSALLFSAGAVLLYAAHTRVEIEPDPIHPITNPMLEAAALETDTAAPNLVRKTTEGDTIDLSKLSKNGPVYLVFIKDNCPCSVIAQPYFQRLYDAFGGKATFVGITDADLSQAKDWKSHFQMTFPLISDPKLDLMKAYHATNSAFSELIGQDGRVVHQWPGYNRQILGNIEEAIANAAHLPDPNMDVSDVSTKPSAGCTFS